MSQIFSFHAFRRGAGTSSLVASVGGILASQGKRVGIVDADLQSPSMHIFWGLAYSQIRFTLNDYLYGQCQMRDALYEITPYPGIPTPGKVFLLPASSDPLKIMQVVRQGYDVSALTEALAQLAQDFSLNYVLVDANAGLNVESLASLAIADAAVLILRLDQQEYQGAASLLEIVRRMGTARMLFVINDVPATYKMEDVAERVAGTYHLPPDFIIPHSDDMLALASSSVFSLEYPQHHITHLFAQLTSRLTT